jgi:hypothetical protein
VRPERHDPLADVIPLDQLQPRMDRLRAAIREGVAAMPTHEQALSGPARARPAA